MFKYHNFLFWFTGLNASLLLVSCQSRKFSEIKEKSAFDISEKAMFDSVHMRNLFHSYLVKQNSSISEDDTKSLFYLRSEKQNFMDLQTNIRHTNADNSKADSSKIALSSDVAEVGTQSRFLNTFFRSLKPSELYEQGAKIPIENLQNLNRNLGKSGPITYVLFPGITVEFSFSKPFHEILANQQSFFSKTALQVLKTSPRSLATDLQYSLEELKEVNAEASEYTDFASLDDANGKPLAQFIYLKPKLGSLETLGLNSDNAKTYIRRLDKTFEMFKTANIKLDNIVLIGYSRGVTVGLTTLSELNKRQSTSERKSWVENIKGFVNIAGVVYGNELAETYATDRMNPNFVMLKKIDELANTLKDQESGIQPLSRTRTIAENTRAWVKMIKSIPSLPPAESYQGLDEENIGMAVPNVVSMFSFLRNVLFDVFKPSEYFRDVQRFKVFNVKLKQGLESCLRSTAKKWWQTASLPTNIKYYNFLATQGDATEKNSEPWKLTKNVLAYGKSSLDFPVNRSSYYEILRLTGSNRKDLDGETINDGAVEASAAYMHNGFIRALNPNQKELNISFLGYLGTHHWGTVMPYGIAAATEGGVNPFPRSVFINALSEFIAEEIILKK